MSKQKINTNIRLNLDREADRKAWEYLRNMDRKKYKSYSRAIVIAVNDYFDRQERMKKDHYLETREKEDAFLDKVLTTIEQGLKASSSNNTITNLLQLLNAEQPKTELADNTDEYADTALDFADSF
jgi:hypothetical protein